MPSQFIGIQASEGTLSQSRLQLLSTSPNQELLITFTISVPSEVRKKHIALSSPTKRQNYIYFQTTEVWWKAWNRGTILKEKTEVEKVWLCSGHTLLPNWFLKSASSKVQRLNNVLELTQTF